MEVGWVDGWVGSTVVVRSDKGTNFEYFVNPAVSYIVIRGFGVKLFQKKENKIERKHKIKGAIQQQTPTGGTAHI